ncbi:MAG: TonB-dependent receptor, partial [Chitinophagaceae bacterium]
YYLCAFLLTLEAMAAHAQDSTILLKKVTVTAVKTPEVHTAVLPAQSFNKETLQHLNAQSVGEATKYFTGVTVKDYGGIGGLKTVAVRSLGANHTAVMYDGILLSDAQAGQTDLGKLSLDNVQSITLYNAQPAELLLPARSYASASVLAIRTTASLSDSARKYGLTISMRTGSFGLINPSARVRYQFNKRFYNTLYAGWQKADGAYSFKAYEAGGGTEKRKNSDINAFHLEYDAAYHLSDSNVIQLKTYYYDSDRGLPGAIVLYNNATRQRLTDRNFFTQASWRIPVSSKSHLLFNGKYAYNYNYYVDPDYPNSQGKLENTFHQREAYLSGAYEYAVSSVIRLAYASDVWINRLRRTDAFAQGFAEPSRTSWLNNLAVRSRFDRVELQGNLLYTLQYDKVNTGIAARDIKELTPGIAIAYQPFATSPLRLRAFYKNVFRAPTFNDLYYTFIGNVSLRPEYAKQYNVGITYRQNTAFFIQSALITVDAYYNRVKDKILAIPRQNLFQWTMLNIGAVRSKGIDAGVQFYFKRMGSLDLSARIGYTFQDALDVSDKNSTLYKTQLPYTPKHSGSVNVNASYKKFDIGYNVLLSGYRYRLGDPIPENLVKEWATQDLSVSYNLSTRKSGKYRLSLELNNLFNKQYEVIRYYPMPRFNYRVGITIEL